MGFWDDISTLGGGNGHMPYDDYYEEANIDNPRQAPKTTTRNDPVHNTAPDFGIGGTQYSYSGNKPHPSYRTERFCQKSGCDCPFCTTNPLLMLLMFIVLLVFIIDYIVLIRTGSRTSVSSTTPII